MPSPFEVMDVSLQDRLCDPVPNHVYQGDALAQCLALADYVLAPAYEKILGSAAEKRQPGTAWAMVDGMSVAILGIGQVIRQSPDLPNDEARFSRLVAGSELMLRLAAIGKDAAISTEYGYGFRKDTFNAPKHQLHFGSRTAALRDGFMGSPLDGAGCPFRSRLTAIYPMLLPHMMPLFEN